ncbi:hypothetical protein NEISUBOT_05002 [Neisseria subflava NJ9703]|uniref:Uncharacterized protein n=1 Tax=Neisseria subflava NJ9703 TaxID=546268 RepID=A0A9W5IPM7_NEISU|nr:hypothetical protein NEISUBOT_05002 [Neisseria subflava NJ9703]
MTLFRLVIKKAYAPLVQPCRLSQLQDGTLKVKTILGGKKQAS